MSTPLVEHVQNFLEDEVRYLEASHSGTQYNAKCKRCQASRRTLEQYLESPQLMHEERVLADKVWSYFEALRQFEHTQQNHDETSERAACALNEAQNDLDGMLYRYVRYGASDGQDHRKRILVAVDDEAPSEWALQAAIQLAQQLPARIQLLHVVPAGIDNAWDAGCYAQTQQEFFRKQAADLLVQKKSSVPIGICCSTAVREGNPAQQIVNAARRWGADFIFMGTRGRGRLKRFLLGSTAETVIRTAPCPVMTVGHQPRAAGESDRQAEATPARVTTMASH